MKTNRNFSWLFVSGIIILKGVTNCNYQNKVPSYLKGYEDAYVRNSRAAALQWFKEAKFCMFIYSLFSLTEDCWYIQKK